MKTNTVSYFMLFLATVVMATFAVADSPVTTGLVKHVDASALTGLNNGDPVSVWPDLAGYDDMVTYAGEPNYITGVINGLPVVRFNGDGGLVATTATAHFSGDQPHTVFIVAIATEFTGNARCLWQIGRNSGGKYSSFAFEDADSIGNRMGNGYNKFIPSPPYVVGGADLFVSGYSGGGYANYSLDINGAAIPANPNNPANKMSMDDSTICVGNKFTQTASFNGDIAEVLIFNRTLEAGAENEVGYYLATKYALTTSYTPPTFYLLDLSPADGAQRVGQDTQLSWDAHAAVGTPTYRVYFGDDPNDVDPLRTPTPVTTTQDTFYAPVTALAPATLYYWRVEATDDSNSIEGDILTFTTGGDIANLSPDGSIGIATDEVTISWAAESAESTYIDGYNVYLGETLPGTPTDTVTENQLMVSGLTDDTIYQCKVESMHDGSPVSETTVSFTTGKLYSYWPFDDNLTDIIDANDASRAIVQFADGFINEGSAADFAGDFGDEPITAPLLHAVGATANWTISLWEYSYAAGGGWESILGNGADTDGWNTFEFGRYSSNRYVLGVSGGGYKYSPDDSSFLREGWHFHAISHNSETRTIDWYVDGGLVNTYTGTNITLAPELYVGNVKGLSQPFNGIVDDLKLYSRPLTAGQVLQAYIDGVNGAPINPVPASGTGDMPWDPILQWTLVEVPTGISIEVGKLPDLSDATPIALAADATSFDVLTGLGVNLDPSTGYFWRVTATYPAKTSAGPIWFFTVRDLLGDLSGNLVVNTGDVPLMADVWLDDAFITVPSGTEYDYVDQEVWGDDPNLEDYDAYVTPGGPWGESILTVKTDPTPDPTSVYTPPSQTLLWTAWGEGQQLCGLVFPESIDFNDFDKFGFWAYQTGASGNFQFRPIEEGTFNRPFTKTVYGMQSNNDQWYRYEWDIGAQASANIYKVDIWVSGTDFTIEYGNWYLVKNGVDVQVCLEENRIPQDLNFDCSVNLLDLAIMGGDWMLDASN